MAGIIVYPSAFIVSHSEVDEDGVVHEWQEPLSGEAVNSGGAVVLSWEDAQYDLDDLGHPGSDAACNVVIHEFAHKIDMLRGDANGYPPFFAKYHQGISAELWQQGFTRAYADFSARLDVLEQQLPPDFDPDDPACAAHYDALTAALPLDPYAAYHPAEFFAVASEAFFVRPAPMAAAYPEIYRLLSQYYRQDTLSAA
jgi:Mlc titration factor MtfA (ptsG expression regulator)